MIVPRHKICDMCGCEVGKNLRYFIIKSKCIYDGYGGACSDNKKHHICERCMSSISECNRLDKKRHEKWEYLKEHITEMRDADGELNQKDTCKFILNLMGVIEKEGESKWSNMKYCVCCPMCDKDKCVRGTEECDAEKWEKEKAGENE